MTREEIERSFQYNMTDAFIKWDKAVNTEYKEENEEAFYQGAYEAQKYLIGKACEWLRRNYTNYMVNDLSKYVEDVCSFDIFDDLLVDDFRKAMEEK